MGTLWIAAAVAGVALAVALASLFPDTRRGKWEAVLLVLAVAAFAALRALPERPENENGDPRTALLLFIGVAIYFALMRVSFTGWFRRQEELVRLGRPVEKLKVRHYTVMLLGFVVSMAIVIPLR